VLDLLQVEPLRLRFGLESDDLERIRHWVIESGVRWAVDERHRAEWGLPRDDANTWRHGLNRLLLGYACADDDHTVFRGIVPFDDVAASDAVALGGLLEFTETLFQLRDYALGPGADAAFSRTADEWCAGLAAFVPRLFAPSSEDWSLEAVFEALSAIARQARLAETTAPIPLSVLIHLLEQGLGGRRQSTDFLAGGITFCELLPLRTIPFRIICVLGMNQGEFPRPDRPLGYDKMRERVQLGDRNIRLDDRYLFLEMLMAARDRISLSYVGRSIQDNSAKPPSVVVSELGRVLEAMVNPEERKNGAAWRATEHPLQPFSPRYFDGSDPRLNSTSALWLDGAQALTGQARAPEPFCDDDLSLDEAVRSNSGLNDVVRFFRNPARTFLHRLGVVVRDEIEAIEDREPLLIDALSAYQIGEHALGVLGVGGEVVSEVAQRRGDFPFGSPGLIQSEEIMTTVRQLFAEATAERTADPAPIQRFSLTLEVAGTALQLDCEVDHLYGHRRIVCSYGAFKAKRRLEAWLFHLAACAGLEGFEGTTWIARDKKNVVSGGFRVVEPERARRLLGELVEIQLEGQRRALRFDCEAALALLDASARDKGEGWQTSRPRLKRIAEGRSRFLEFELDGSLVQLFGSEDPYGFDSANSLEELPLFVLAARVFGPLKAEESP
jgi:exodeoxyribonuclease V gamma subunit